MRKIMEYSPIKGILLAGYLIGVPAHAEDIMSIKTSGNHLLKNYHYNLPEMRFTNSLSEGLDYNIKNGWSVREFENGPDIRFRLELNKDRFRRGLFGSKNGFSHSNRVSNIGIGGCLKTEENNFGLRGCITGGGVVKDPMNHSIKGSTQPKASLILNYDF